MNITITQISNGWVVTIANPKGQVAIYKEFLPEIIEELNKIQQEPPSTSDLVTKKR